MSLPSSNMRATDYNLGIVPPSPGRSVVKVGVASAGDFNTLVYPATKTDLVSTFTSGPAVEAAGLAMDYPGRGNLGVLRCNASVAGAAGSVTKTDPAGAVGTAVSLLGEIRLTGADKDGNVLFQALDAAATLTVVSGGANGYAATGKDVTLTVTNTATGTDIAGLALGAAAGIIAQPVALGTGASVVGQSLAKTAFSKGGLSITPKVQGPVRFKTVVPNSSGASLAVSASGNDITITLGTDANSQIDPTKNTATLVKAQLDAQAGTLVTTTLAGDGAGLVGQQTSFLALVFGSTAAVTVSGEPLDAWPLRVKGSRAGGVGSGAFRFSLDGGDVYSDEIAYPSGGSYTIPGSGLTLGFTGNLAVGDLFSATCSAPTWNNSDLATVLDAAIASTSSYSIVHVVGPMDATSFATVSTKAASAEAVKKFLLFIVEAPGQASNQTNAQWSASVVSTFANSTDKRIGICAMECELTSTLNQPQAGRTMRRPLAWALAARAGSIPISEDIGRVASGPLLGVVSVYQLDQAETLDAAGFSTAFTLEDFPGFYGSGKLKSPSGSDFVLWQDIRLINEVMRVGYKGQTRYLNDALRVREEAAGQYPAGSIDPADAQTVEAYLDGLLRDALVTPGYVTAARAIVDRTVNMVTQKLLKVKYEATPLGTVRTIDGTAGLKNPAIDRL